MADTPNRLARDYLAAARQRLDTLPAALGQADEALYWAVSDIHLAIQHLLAIVEATDPVLAATGEEESARFVAMHCADHGWEVVDMTDRSVVATYTGEYAQTSAEAHAEELDTREERRREAEASEQGGEEEG